MLELGHDDSPDRDGPLEITSSRMGYLWDALSWACDVLGFDTAARGDEVFRQLVLARVVEPTSKLDSLRVLSEVGIESVSYRTVKRRLPVFAKEQWRAGVAAACAPARLAGAGKPGAV